MGFTGRKVDAFYFKAQQMSIQRGKKIHGTKGKDLPMKEIKNLTMKNPCFGEIKFDDATQEMKDRALLLSMLMGLKRNGYLKTRGVANGSKKCLCADKIECSFPTLDFCAFKHAHGVMAKETRGFATVDLPGLFLQTDRDGEELMLLKLKSAIALLLVESDESKCRNHLVR